MPTRPLVSPENRTLGDDEPTGSNRRAYTRIPYPVPVSLMSHNNLWAGVSNDISEGGVFIVTRQPPDVGTMVEMDLTLDGGGELIHLMGIVRWQRLAGPGIDGPAGVGIQFIDLPAPLLVRLQAFIKQRETMLWEP